MTNSNKTNSNLISPTGECNKAYLIDKIKKATNEICILSATAFDFNWDDLIDILFEKFKNYDNFTMKIIRESENLIAQYSLLSGNQIEDGIAASRGNMNNIRNNVTKFKQELLKKINEEKNNVFNLEPVEDIKKNELKEVDAKTERDYILEVINETGCLYHFRVKLHDVIKSSCLLPTFNKKLSEFIFIKLNENDIAFISVLNKVSEHFNKFVDTTINKISNIIVGLDRKCDQNELAENDPLKEIKISSFFENLEEFSNGKIMYSYDEVTNFVIELNFKEIEKVIQNTVLTYFADYSVIEFYKNKGIEKKYKNVDKYINEINYKLRVQHQLVEKRKVYIREEKLNEFFNDPKVKQRLFIKDCYVPLPIPMIKIDDELYITQALTKFTGIDKFQCVGCINGPVNINGKQYESRWADDFRKYYNKYFGVNSNVNDPDNIQKYMTEETEKGDRKEVIDIFNEKRVRIGSGPRDAFLANMSIVKSVVWALLFTRDGRMLIHQRSANAKDNRELWDKSVGGHVSVEDLDTIESAKREIAEELFTMELEGQGGHGQEQWTVTNKNKIIYLGDWKTQRFPDLNQLSMKSDEYYTFSLNYENIQNKDMRKEIIVTERVLPDGEIKKAKCFVDAYLSIVAEDFNIKKLYNSKFALLTPNELKSCVLQGKATFAIKDGVKVFDKNGESCEFKVTSDLKYLVNSDIWDDVVTEFSRRVKETFKN